ncbi:MAG: UvrD-helicase domain-containing protein, partial [Saprospiraceae bacterium]
MNLRIISAGAGSGKTYRLTSEMVDLLKSGKVKASGIIATTFTNKAAAELQERVRIRLLEEGLTEQADQLTNALIGTVHGLGVKLLKRFAYEAGVSPEVSIIADEDQQVLFNNALATVLTGERVQRMERLCDKLGLNKNDYFDWRKEVRQVTEVARANAFDKAILKESCERSITAFQQFLEPQSGLSLVDFNAKLAELLDLTITALQGNADETKTTKTATGKLQQLQRTLNLRGFLHWYELVKISKVKPGAKSRDDVEELKDYVLKHETLAEFHQDIAAFIQNVFELAMEAIREYDEYKKRRGLIDYTDMEVHIKELLKNQAVQEVMSAELDLLMVDEFQDTSPIQLEIFLQLSKFAKHSVWVGDPKQSIYGFRGADPELMQAVMDKTGGVKPEDIQTHSWRSREDVVFATNALFCKAFSQLPEAQVALQPKRQCKASADSINKEDEPFEVTEALQHWHFSFEGGKRIPGKPWMENCIAETTRRTLDGQIWVKPKDEKEWRLARAGDVAILCRSNKSCQEMANA